LQLRDRPRTVSPKVLSVGVVRCLDRERRGGTPHDHRRRTVILTITPQALILIRSVTSNSKLDGASGLRIEHQADPSAPLAVRAVSGPEAGDHVVEEADGRLFLDPEAVRRIGERRLDAEATENGRVQFVLRAA
jgi:iron-sulfur cluster assembly protein